MNKPEERLVELPALAQLQSLGWQYLDGRQLAPDGDASLGGASERSSLRDVVLVQRLETAIRQLNPWISDDNCRLVMRRLTHLNCAALMEYNQAIYDLLVNYISVDQDIGKGRKGQTVKVIDFDHPENNDFLCVNQFKVNGPVQNIIPDIICFVNGLPLAVIECKAPYISDPMAEGIKQLRRYANRRRPEDNEGAEKLFWYNQLMVSTCRDKAEVGTISSNAQYFSAWKDAYPFTDNDILQSINSNDIDKDQESDYSANSVNAQQRLIAGMFNPASFLDLIQNFTIFELDKSKVIKKIARYQQFRAVNKVIERLKDGSDRKAKSGVVWHTQGSGKSLTMVMLAMKIRRDAELKQHKLVFITDRTQLDKQLSATFNNAQNETIYNAASVADLKELLRKDSSDIVTAMVQKFRDMENEAKRQDDTLVDGFKDLNPSDKIIVLADEAHRTQFGGLAMTINAALPNAPKIGFTGTPLLKTDKMDHAFGGYIDEYKINEAVDDGATVRILYEGRQVKTHVEDASLDYLFDEYFSDYSDDEKQEIRRRYGIERAIREAPRRIKMVCEDLVKHYEQTVYPNGYKAMIVVGSRHAAVQFKDTLNDVCDYESAVIISGNHNNPQRFAQYTNKADQEKIITDFTKPFGTDIKKNNNVAFLIVKDMLLTGFDAPIAQVMYIDRQLKDHTLMQAIARVNRTCPSPKQDGGAKQNGYIVDYYGLAEELKDAMKLFTETDVEGSYYTLKDEIPLLEATHLRAMNFFKGIKARNEDAYIMALKDEATRSQFDQAFKKFAKQMEVVLPDEAAQPFLKDLRFLGKVHHDAKLQFRDEALDISEAGEKVRQLVDDHIFSLGVDPMIAPVDLLAANFKETLQAHTSDESKASEIESAIKAHITVNLDEDPVYYQALSDKLKDIIQKTADKWQEQVQLLLILRDTMESDRQQQATDHGFSDTQMAFYRILEDEVIRLADDEIMEQEQFDLLKTLTENLVDEMEQASQIVDFFQKPDAIKTVRKNIKRALHEANFEDIALVKAIQERFMELAKVKFST